jgi:hypothetical protein
MSETGLSIALIHHPVLNKVGETIGSAVTNLDLHDIARVARTYGVSDYYVATPFEDQHELIKEITDHWLHGQGARANPARKKALSILRPARNLDEVVEQLSERYEREVMIVATSARRQRQVTQIDYPTLRQRLGEQKPVLLVFGTAHGLAPALLQGVDAVLEPIQPDSDYNHLSVRSAVSIVLDRLLGMHR